MEHTNACPSQNIAGRAVRTFIRRRQGTVPTIAQPQARSRDASGDCGEMAVVCAGHPSRRTPNVCRTCIICTVGAAAGASFDTASSYAALSPVIVFSGLVPETQRWCWQSPPTTIFHPLTFNAFCLCSTSSPAVPAFVSEEVAKSASLCPTPKRYGIRRVAALGRGRNARVRCFVDFRKLAAASLVDVSCEPAGRTIPPGTANTPRCLSRWRPPLACTPRFGIIYPARSSPRCGRLASTA